MIIPFEIGLKTKAKYKEHQVLIVITAVSADFRNPVLFFVFLYDLNLLLTCHFHGDSKTLKLK